jgi:hypothetical protein
MKDLERALDECLAGLRSESLSIEACLSRYPQHAAQLAPMLRVTVLARSASEAAPSPAFRNRLRARLLKPGSRRAVRPASGLNLAPLRAAALLLTLTVIALTTGTAFAQRALPGAPLYAWKRLSETTWRGVSNDPIGVDLALSKRRVDEWIAVANDAAHSQAALEEYQGVVSRLLAASTDDDHERIQMALKAEEQLIEAAGLTLPPLDPPIPWLEGSHPADDQPETVATPSAPDQPAPASKHLTALPPPSSVTPQP